MLAWLAFTAFVSLPNDLVGFRGWLKPCTVEDEEHIHELEETELVSFSLETDPVTCPSIFAFRDVTMILNLSWLAFVSSRKELDFLCL